MSSKIRLHHYPPTYLRAPASLTKQSRDPSPYINHGFTAAPKIMPQLRPRSLSSQQTRLPCRGSALPRISTTPPQKGPGVTCIHGKTDLKRIKIHTNNLNRSIIASHTAENLMARYYGMVSLQGIALPSHRTLSWSGGGARRRT